MTGSVNKTACPIDDRQAEARALHPRQAEARALRASVEAPDERDAQGGAYEAQQGIKYPMASSLQRRANVQVSCLNTSTCGKGSAVLSSFGNPPAGAVGGRAVRARVGCGGRAKGRWRACRRAACKRGWVGVLRNLPAGGGWREADFRGLGRVAARQKEKPRSGMFQNAASRGFLASACRGPAAGRRRGAARELAFEQRRSRAPARLRAVGSHVLSTFS